MLLKHYQKQRVKWSMKLSRHHVKLISHITILKIDLIQWNFHCLTKNFLVYRTRTWKLDNSNRKSSRGQYAQFYFIKKGILYRSMVDNGHKFEAAVVPEDLIHTVFTFRSQSVRPQWISKDVCCNQACLLLGKGWENMYWFIAKVVPHVLKQRVQKNTIQKANL